MRDALFHLRREETESIQSQIRKMLVSAILDGQLPTGDPLPSSRQLARSLGVSRNTVVLAYQGLVDDGYLTARERSGFFVNSEILAGRVHSGDAFNEAPARGPAPAPDWAKLFKLTPSRQRNIRKPPNWHTYPYPFIYGQVDRDLFPIAEWRECSRQALVKKAMDSWTGDTLGRDDPMLVEQIRTRLLPRRGIRAGDDEILITLGAQNALYLVASLLIDESTRIAIEDPGYPDVRNIALLKTRRVDPIAVDEGGLPVDGRLDGCDLVFVTPSHQFPTTVTMPIERRQALLDRAAASRLLIIEDDYECETNYVREPTPALKSLDTENRVIYVGSLSKTLFPGLRLGYLVGSRELIREARALRRLMLRHPASNNQRTTALFLALGHHDALVHRLHRAYRARWEQMGESLARHLPYSFQVPTFGGTSYWVEGPEALDADRLAEEALKDGVVIEPGRVHFAAEDGPSNCFRLGFSSIAVEKIDPGIKRLAALIERHMVGRS
ncbi:MAG: PLP-dependent aminotransferase family protein [Rhodospirillales bacterium]|nr:PLP-dependent aminotransferase family protein [Rhodospirillales bacterium]